MITFPDVNLSILQVEALKKRNNIISHYKEQKNMLEQERNDLETELAKRKEYFEER